MPLETRDFLRILIPRILVPALLTFSFLVPQVIHAADRGTTFDRSADFSTYETYEWVAANPKSPEGSPLSLGAEGDTLIRNAIERELVARGFRQAIDEDPDFLVTFDGALQPVTEFEGQRRQLAEGVAWVVDGNINSYQKGTLVITFTNPRTKKPVWSAWTTEKVKNPDRPKKQIDKSVRKMLRKFPPKPEKKR